MLYNGAIYVYGGLIGAEETEVMWDLWKLDLTTRYCIPLNNMYNKLPPLFDHCAGVTQDGCMYVFGGYRNTNDMWPGFSSVIKVWLDVPSLQDLCWEVVLDSLRENIDLDNVDDRNLQSLKIPDHLKATLVKPKTVNSENSQIQNSVPRTNSSSRWCSAQ